MIADRASHTVAAAALSGCLLVARGAAAGDAAAGARLAAERCASCHSSTDTTHSTVPLLEGQPKAYFIAQWRAFRERERTAPLMVSLAAELSEQDVDDLAEYYAAQAARSSRAISRAIVRQRCRSRIGRSFAMCQLPRSGVARDGRRRGTTRRAKGALHRLVVAVDAQRHPVAWNRRKAGSAACRSQQRRDRVAGHALGVAALNSSHSVRRDP